MNRLSLLLILPLFLCACGRKWERFWGQDTRPETRYIPLVPGQIILPIGTLNPVQWADTRFRDAKYLGVWACTDTDICTSIPQDTDNGIAQAVYIVTERAVISVYNVKDVYPLATKIKIEFVL